MCVIGGLAAGEKAHCEREGACGSRWGGRGVLEVERRGRQRQISEERGVSLPEGSGNAAHLAGEGVLGGFLGVCAGDEVLVVHLRQLTSELLLCQDKNAKSNEREDELGRADLT